MAASTSGSAMPPMRVPIDRKYLDTLTNESRKKYQEKLNLINNIDPYDVSSNFFTESMEMWPNVEYPDIVTYFLCSTSRYTKEQIEAYKSLESYQYFIAGWVRCVFVGRATSNIKILIGKVSILVNNLTSAASQSPIVFLWNSQTPVYSTLHGLNFLYYFTIYSIFKL